MKKKLRVDLLQYCCDGGRLNPKPVLYTWLESLSCPYFYTSVQSGTSEQHLCEIRRDRMATGIVRAATPAWHDVRERAERQEATVLFHFQ